MPRKRGRQRRFRTPVTGRISHLTAQGLGQLEQDLESERRRPVVMVGALPGESVEAVLHERKGPVDTALLEKSDASHPDRVEPPCAHFLDCSGCVLQHLSASAQIAHKQELLRNWAKEAQLRIGRWEAPITGPTQGYRRKARLAVRWVEKKGRALIGFRELRDGRFVADIRRCTNLDPQFDELIPLLSALVASLSIASKVAQAEIAAGDEGSALVLRVLETPSAADMEKLLVFEKQHPWQLWLQPGGMDTITTLDGQLLSQKDSGLCYRLDDGRLEFRFGPDNFIQINRVVNEQMIQRAMAWLDPGPQDVVLDLFCGLGNFTLPLGLRAKEVVGAESDPALLERAKKNARLNGLENIRFVAQDLYAQEPLTQLACAGANKVLLDPPRSGAGAVIAPLIESQVERIVYVACGPTAMIQELKVLQDAGFEIEAMSVLDMFPHTAHFESMALLSRG